MEAASAALEAAGDNWGSATGCIFRATAAARAGDVATVAEMASAIHRHSAAIGYDAFHVPAMLLEAWVAERRMDHRAVEETYRRALELARPNRLRRSRRVRTERTRCERARER